MKSRPTTEGLAFLAAVEGMGSQLRSIRANHGRLAMIAAAEGLVIAACLAEEDDNPGAGWLQIDRLYGRATEELERKFGPEKAGRA